MNLHQKLLAVMRDVDYIQKDQSRRVDGKFTFVSHDQVVAAVRPYLIEHGVSVSISIDECHTERMTVTGKYGERTEFFTTCRATMTWTNADDPADKLVVSSWGMGLDPTDKSIGKAISYATKYGLLKGLMIETGDDPDQDQDQKDVAPPPDPQKSASSEDKITPDQMKKIFVLAKELGWGAGDRGKENVKNFIFETWGVNIASMNDLTITRAGKLIDAMTIEQEKRQEKGNG